MHLILFGLILSNENEVENQFIIKIGQFSKKSKMASENNLLKLIKIIYLRKKKIK